MRQEDFPNRPNVVAVESRIVNGAEVLSVVHTDDLAGRKPVAFDLTNCVVFATDASGPVSQTIYIRHPYTVGELVISYADNELFAQAAQVSQQESLDFNHPTATILLSPTGDIVSAAANGSDYHTLHGCERVRLGIPTGQGYELCEGCHPKNHSEVKATEKAIAQGTAAELVGGRAFLWGHWWCCETCTNTLVDAGVTEVILSKNWTKQFLGL